MYNFARQNGGLTHWVGREAFWEVWNDAFHTEITVLCTMWSVNYRHSHEYSLVTPYSADSYTNSFKIK